MTGGSYDISIWWRNTMISMSLSVSVRREDRSRPRIRHRPRQQRVKATADHGRWWRTLPAQSSDRGFGALHLSVPKADLVATLEVVLSTRRLHVVPDLALAKDLDAELRSFSYELSATGRPLYEV